jgi:hypothetical protein
MSIPSASSDLCVPGLRPIALATDWLGSGMDSTRKRKCPREAPKLPQAARSPTLAQHQFNLKHLTTGANCAWPFDEKQAQDV